ncbi:MAG: BrnA antitoxin family protein, partial [Spirochaetaceae bacterium]|nr:BrnA antitoxin family protein [Spirochaetaceae bacterium]
KLDADVVAWLKSGGKGYQTRLNNLLRSAMASAPKRERQAAPQSH